MGEDGRPLVIGSSVRTIGDAQRPVVKGGRTKQGEVEEGEE